MRLAALILVLLVTAPARAERDGSTDAITIGILAGVTAILTVWDVKLAVEDKRTESQLLTRGAWNANVLPYTLGLLAGHLFFPTSTETQSQRWKIGLASIAVYAASDIACYKFSCGRPAWRYPGIPFGLGVGMGVVTLSQRF